VPLRIGDETPNWILNDLAAFAALDRAMVERIVIEVVNLATGLSTRVEGRTTGALSAALKSLQSA
jgi:hypothetical protein